MENWVTNNQATCPYCNKQNSKFVAINPSLMTMIKQLKFECVYSKYGCNYSEIAFTLDRHELTCNFKPNEQEVEAGPLALLFK
jgi:hypothetical protein